MTIKDKNCVFIPVTPETKVFLIGNGIDISKSVWRSNYNGTFYKAVAIKIDEGATNAESISEMYNKSTECEKSFFRRHQCELTIDQPKDDEHNNADIASTFNLEDYAIKKDLHTKLHSLLNELNDLDRKIIVLKYFNGYTQEQIGKEVSLAQNSVSKRLKKILLTLRQQLKDFY